MEFLDGFHGLFHIPKMLLRRNYKLQNQVSSRSITSISQMEAFSDVLKMFTERMVLEDSGLDLQHVLTEQLLLEQLNLQLLSLPLTNLATNEKCALIFFF